MNTAARVGAHYPREKEADVVLKDGSTVHVRPVRPGDEQAIRTFLQGLSPESISFRFFGVPNLDWVIRWSMDVDYSDRFALVAVSGTHDAIIAHAVYIRVRGELAEVAFLVADSWQGRGIATNLIAHLAAIAQEHGISTFEANVLPQNHRMIDVFRESGFPVEMRSAPDAIVIEFPTSLSEIAIARFEERERTAAVAAVRRFLEPRSVAVIGASRRRETLGGKILCNLLASDFKGALYAVNEHADTVHSLPSYRSITAVPEAVDLAVVVAPADRVLGVARECAEAGVRALLVISSGFGEAGEHGARRQRDLVEVCRDAGIRIIGPNCHGVLNTDSRVQLNATFAPRPAVPGRVGFLSQGGSIGIVIIEAAARLGVGLSSFVSVGNQSDLSGNDFLQYWEQDANTDLVLLYLESFGNPRKFARVAPRVARRKPVIALTSGRSGAGARATCSHVGAMLSAFDVTVDALFEHAGVIRTDTTDELLDVAALMASQPVPRGGRVVIVTNAGPPGIRCADACRSNGIVVREPPPQVLKRLREFLPTEASLGNPIDLIASASAEDYRRTLRTLIDADACDAIIVIFVAPLVTAASDVAIAVRETAQSAPGTAVAAVFMTSDGIPAELHRESHRVPGYGFPEDAARAIAHAVRHGRWLAHEEGRLVTPEGMRRNQAAAIISEELARGSGWLSLARVSELLDCYGLPLVPTLVVGDADQAVAAAAQLGVPVALKAAALGIVHRSDWGGVLLGLEDGDAVRNAALKIEAALARAGRQLDGLVVQPMAPDGVELLVGVVSDPSFGPVLACGAAGTTAELVNDVAVRITPVTDLDAREMVRSLKTYPRLEGYRGAPQSGIAAVEDVLLRVSAMVDAHHEIIELECNPLIVTPDGALIVGARMRIEAAPPPAPRPSLLA